MTQMSIILDDVREVHVTRASSGHLVLALFDGGRENEQRPVDSVRVALSPEMERSLLDQLDKLQAAEARKSG